MNPNYLYDNMDLAKMSSNELKHVAQQVRELIVSVVSENGGHLAPSLGVVELTIALLAAFKPPKDKIIWDVGHQCYAYKILTDRLDVFRTLRQDGGVSGFPSMTESCCDAFGTGHATTSISAALGYALSRDYLGEDHKVVAVIGDGALTGGIAWEAVNNAGASGTDVLVILNDNGMSISPNVGALAEYTTKIRSQPICRNVRDRAIRLLGRRLASGRLLTKAGEAISRGLTHWVSPRNGTIFEALGFAYIGPVDGHDVPLLKALLSRVKHLKGPVLLHVVTKKGKGYKHAEKNSQIYHGVGNFNVSNGKIEGANKPSLSHVFGDALVKIAEEMPEVCAITAAMPDGTGLSDFARMFPDRFYNVGIAEEHAVVFAAGLAAGGLKPVVAIYSTFLQRAYDQILHDVCLQNLPVVFAVDRAGIVGQDGATHQGVFDIAYLRHIPNLTVMAPRNGDELRLMLQHALASNGPCAIRYPRDGDAGTSSVPIQPIEMGRSETIIQGTDIAILGLGGAVDRCVEAARLLVQEGLSVAVINARFIKPLDEEMLLKVIGQVGILVTVEEHIRQCGFGSAVLESLNQWRQPTDRVLTIALPDSFIPHGDSSIIRKRHQFTAAGIAERIQAFLNELNHNS